MNGLVVKSTGNSIGVQIADGTVVDCRIKGNMRIAGIRTTNPVAVGDNVVVEQQNDGTCWITQVLPRKNYIVRRSTNLSKQAHVLAANLDAMALLVTIDHPVTSTTFIDRILATAEAYSVPAMILFNKIDLLDDEGKERLNALMHLYNSLGYPTYAISAKHGDVGQIRNILAGKTTLLSGNSGVGKSTLLNALFGKELTRTADISQAHNKGMHTTTFSEMYRLEPDGWVIDTPGVKGFGMIDMKKEEIGHYFKEIFTLSRQCRYSDCIHCGEPGCAVLPAVGTSIAESRFDSYLSMLSDEAEDKYR